jgi:hypothetical protein
VWTLSKDEPKIEKSSMKISKKTLYHVREYADIAQPKGHATVGKCPKRTGKRRLFLIFGVDKDLVISRITIQEAIVIMPS